MGVWQAWSVAAAGSGTASGAELVAGAGWARRPGLVGQLVQVSGERCSAQQLLWSKAETEALKGPAVTRHGSSPKGSGTKLTGHWGHWAWGSCNSLDS